MVGFSVGPFKKQFGTFQRTHSCHNLKMLWHTNTHSHWSYVQKKKKNNRPKMCETQSECEEDRESDRM